MLFFEAEGFFQAGEEIGDDQGRGLELFFQVSLYFAGVDALEHVVELGIGFGIFNCVAVDVTQEGQGFGDFPFGNFVDLEVDFFAEGVDGGLAVLTHKDEEG